MNKEFAYTTGGFPVSENRLDDLQQAYKFLEKISLAVGDLAILEGCVNTSGTVSNGTVVINGKIYPFVGGAVAAHVIISTVVTQLTYADGNKNYKTEYTAQFGTGGTQYDWADFVRVDTNKTLMSQMAGKLSNVEGSITTAALVNDWFHDTVSSVDYTISFLKNLIGEVVFMNTVSVITKTNDVIATLPLAFRPTNNVYLTVGYSQSPSNNNFNYGTAIMYIKPNGEMRVLGIANGETEITLFLQSVRFRLDLINSEPITPAVGGGGGS